MFLIPNHFLPKVHPSKIEKGMSFRDLQKRYLDLPCQPLKITGTLLNGYIPSESLHLDGILSSAVFTAHPCSYKTVVEPGIVPLPIVGLWQDKNGAILYASSDFEADVEHKGQEYWHKRYPSTHNEWVKPKQINAKTTAGQYKDYRVPVDVRMAKTVTAYCIGNKDEIQRLLGFITHIGKKSSQGFWRVVNWQVEPVSNVGINEILANRPVPIESGLKTHGKQRHATWTSPYWYKPFAKAVLI